MNFLRVLCPLALLLAWAATWSGCNQSSAVDTQQVQKYRTAFSLDQEPDGAQTVLQVRESLTGKVEAAHNHEGESAHHEEGEADHEHDAHAEHDHDEHADHDHAADSDDDSEADERTVSVTQSGGQEGQVRDAELHHEEHDADDQDHAEHEHGETAHHEEDHSDHDHAAHDHASHDHASHGATEAQDVVMVGMVGGLPNAASQTLPEFPFVKDYAIVMVADPLAVVELEEGGHNHAPGEECAFCAAHAGDQSNFLATVKFTDDSGQVLSVDARQLFDLKEKDVVVIRGKAQLDHDGTLVVEATGLYVRR